MKMIIRLIGSLSPLPSMSRLIITIDGSVTKKTTEEDFWRVFLLLKVFLVRFTRI